MSLRRSLAVVSLSSLAVQIRGQDCAKDLGTRKAGNCEWCPVGKYSTEAGAADCQACPANTWTMLTGSTKSDQCVAVTSADCATVGTFQLKTDSCALCPSGKYSTKDGPGTGAACTDCTGGKWTLGEGSKQEADCKTGFITDADCKTPGTFERVKGTCSLCPLGTFSAVAGAATCSACGTRQSTLLTGRTKKEDCVDVTEWPCSEAGTFKLTADKCAKCPSGKFSTDQPATDNKCSDCTAGTWTLTEGSKQEADCKTDLALRNAGDCKTPGTFERVEGTCSFCPLGKFSAVPGAATCSACGKWQWTLLDGRTTKQDCVDVTEWPCTEQGTFMLATDKCAKCPSGTWSDQTGTQTQGKCKLCVDDAKGQKKWTRGEGSTVATDCKVTLTSAAADTCSQTGSFQLTADPVLCALCPSGKFSPVAQAAQCMDCTPADTWTVGVGKTSANDCVDVTTAACGLKGTFLRETGNCAWCPVGSFSKVGDAIDCEVCKTGFTTAGAGKTADTDCTVQTLAATVPTAHWRPRAAAKPAVAHPAVAVAHPVPLPAQPQPSRPQSMPSAVNTATSLEASRIQQGLLGGYALHPTLGIWVPSAHIPVAAAGFLVALLGSILAFTKLRSREVVGGTRLLDSPEAHVVE